MKNALALGACALLTVWLGGCAGLGTPVPDTGPATPPAATPVATPIASGATAADVATAPRDTTGLIPAIKGLPPEPGQTGSYRIGPFDLLEVQVFQAAELSSKERVSEQGAIFMPLVGRVDVGGLTPEEAETRIAARLRADYLQDPQVNVFIAEYASQKVTVGGAVKKSGVFPVEGRMTLLQAIAKAEGVTPLANQREIIVFRSRAVGDVNAYVVDLKAIQAGQLGDPTIVGGDRVIVPESGTAVFLKGVTDTLRGFVRPFF